MLLRLFLPIMVIVWKQLEQKTTELTFPTTRYNYALTYAHTYKCFHEKNEKDSQRGKKEKII